MCIASATKMGIICHGSNSKLMQQQVCPGHVSQVRLCGRNEDEPSLKQLAGQRKGDSKYPMRGTAKYHKASVGELSFPAGSKRTTSKSTAISSHHTFQKAKDCPSIKSSDSRISIYKRTSIAITIFSRTGLTFKSRNVLNSEQEKKPRDHTALSLSSTSKM